MISKGVRAAVLGTGALLAASLPGVTAWASASDYRFEVVNTRPAGTGKTDITVRLVHLPDNRPVPDAVIFQTRADMAPAGMPTMTGSVAAPQAGPQPGTYRLQVETGMAGSWALTFAAKVQGEAETVRAQLTFTAAR
jgi:hypothetical protein